MALLARQESFAQNIALGMSISDAYRAAYKPDSSKVTADQVNKRASRILSNVEIKRRVEELRKPIIAKVGLTLEVHLQELADLRDASKKDKKYAAAVQAEIARGKAAGIYVDKIELGNKDGEAFKMQDLSKLSVQELETLMVLRDKIDGNT